MNEQLPPVDRDLRGQLSRRSAGRLPDDLLVATYARLDVARPQPRRWTGPRLNRLTAAGAACALIVVLTAALVVVPRFQTAPATSALAGYPAERALTTAELAAVMAGPALATNTALVASVTVDVRYDVCPMDRYRTVGVIEGMHSQVCVMSGSDVQTEPARMIGVFAFRYLAPGVLGLLGEITPASSAKAAFRVADDWPLQGKTFLVDGWLGAEGLLASCVGPVQQGDVLAPYGDDCPYEDWLADDPNRRRGARIRDESHGRKRVDGPNDPGRQRSPSPGGRNEDDRRPRRGDQGGVFGHTRPWRLPGPRRNGTVSGRIAGFLDRLRSLAGPCEAGGHLAACRPRRLARSRRSRRHRGIPPIGR